MGPGTSHGNLLRPAGAHQRVEEGLPGRLNLKKALIVVAAQEDGPGIGRIRMRQIPDASAKSLAPFVRDSVLPGSVIHTDGWLGYLPLESQDYRHDITFLQGKKKTPSELMPRVHRVISLLKRWLMGTHQGAVIKCLPGVEHWHGASPNN